MIIYFTVLMRIKVYVCVFSLLIVHFSFLLTQSFRKLTSHALENIYFFIQENFCYSRDSVSSLSFTIRSYSQLIVLKRTEK